MVLLTGVAGLTENNDSPRITLAPRDQKVTDNAIVSFMCKASGNPAPEVTWRKGGKVIRTKQRHTIMNMPHGSVLRIETVKPKRDDGTIECVADNGIGEAVASATLEVYPENHVPSGYPRIVESPSLKAVEKDRSATMVCSATGNPDPTVTWLKDFIPVDVTDPRLTILPTGSLQIRHSLESDEGKYECVAENSVGIAYSYGANLYVRVRRVPPHFSIPPESAEVMPGGAVNLTCVAIGSPMPSVRWRLAAVDLTPEDNIPFGKNILMLTDIRESATYTCVAMSDLGNIEAYAEIRVKALPKPPSSVLVSDVSPSTVRLSWNSGNIDPIGLYVIQYRQKFSGPGTDFMEIENIPTTEHTIHDLSAHTTYEFRVLAVNSIGRGLPSTPADVTTGELVPGSPPINVRARPVSSSTVVVQWDEPLMANGIIRGYKVYYTLSPAELPVSLWTVHQVDNSQLTTITNLMTNRTYTISVLAFTSVGDGPLSEPIQVKTQQGVPEQPTNLQGEALSPNSIQLTWDAPEATEANLESYELYFNDSHFRQNIRVTINPPQHSYLLEDLTPDTIYHIRVAAKSSRGEGASTPTIQVRTMDYVPGEPGKVKFDSINSTAIGVHWQPPATRKHHGIIRGYQIHYVQVGENNEHIGDTMILEVESSKSEAILSNLVPDAFYQLQVSAFTRKGEGERTRSKRVKTKGAVPSAPRSLQLAVTQEDPPIVSVSWQAPKISHGNIEGYKLTYGVLGESYVEERRFDGEKYRFTTAFLERGAEYEFRIAARNNVDFGSYTAEVIKTPDGLPTGAPQNFTAIGLSQTSIKLQWDPPAKRHRNGEIVLYEILYHRRIDSSEDFATNSTGTMAIVDGLEVSTDYIFQLRAYTIKGSGPWSNKLPFRTFGHYGLPAPKNVKLRRVSSTALEVSWDPPPVSGIAGYRIHYNMFAIPDIDKWLSVEIGPYTVAELSGLEPHTSYAVRVRAKGIDGRYGNFSETMVSNKLESEHPDTVQEFHVRTQNPRSVMLEWKPPRKPGVLRYVVDYQGIKKSHDPSGIENTIVDPRKGIPIEKENRTLYIERLLPKTVYTFNISTKFIDGTTGPPYTIHVETSADAPPDLEAPVILNQLERKAVVHLRPASGDHGFISHYLVVVVPAGLAKEKSSSGFRMEELSESRPPDHTAWIAAQFDANRLPQEMVIGDGKMHGTEDYINWPLPPGHNYVVFLRAFGADNKYRSSSYSEPLLLEPLGSSVISSEFDQRGIDLLWIVAPICIAIVFLLLLILIVIVARKRRAVLKEVLPEPSKVMLPSGDTMSSHPIDPVEMRRLHYQTPAMMSHPPVPVHELESHIESLRANDGVLFSQEYESIEPGQQFTWEASNLDVNKSKNRYANVISYDHSRVILQPLDGIVGSDYINANYMDGYRKQNAYIATQGPLPDTFADFWRLVWEQHCPTIVMMTKLEERNRCKCDQYWPNRGSETYGVMQVTLLDVIELASYTIRTFQLSKDYFPEKREIRHFQFTGWPDHGVPDHPAPLLLFMRRAKFMTPPDSGPVVVHCSAGVGRTGVYIVIDAMLERIKHVRSVDIYGHVTCLRAQRNYMVQTEDQYIFIHDAVLEAIQLGNTEIPARNLYLQIQKLTERIPGESFTGMELEFKRLSLPKSTPSKFVSATLPSNKLKNRLVNVLPYEFTRVVLQPIRGVDGSDYINASFIDGYRYKKAYIATQGPLPETAEDFWRMLWEYNCNIVVMLTKLREVGREKCHQYWPSERSARYQYFVVDPLAEYNMPQYILREFKVTDARDGQSRTVRQFQFTDWPEQGIPGTGDGFIEFIGQVHKTKEQFGQDGPITVHCSAGVGRTGVFITLSIVLERMRFECVVDMFQTVNILRTQRPAMVQTEDQYAFCYRAALEYLGSFDHYTN